MRSRTFSRGQPGRRLAAGVLAVAAASLAAAGDAPAATCAGADQVPRASTVGAAADATLCVINRERASRDLPRLHSHTGLERAGRRYARDLVRKRFFSHTSPGGSSMTDRLRAIGYADPDRSWSIGETLAWGVDERATPSAIVSAWLASRPHRRLLLDPDFRDVGIGVSAGVPVRRHADGPGATYAAELGVRP